VPLVTRDVFGRDSAPRDLLGTVPLVTRDSVTNAISAFVRDSAPSSQMLDQPYSLYAYIITTIKVREVYLCVESMLVSLSLCHCCL